MEALILNLAPTGLLPTRAQTPHVPLSIEEITQDCLRCAALGASMFHLHARHPDGSPSSDPVLFGELIASLRQALPEAILISTTSGRRCPDLEQRAASLHLEGASKPDMASLTLGSLNFSQEASLNAPDTIRQLARRMKEHGIRPELEVFDLGMLNFAKILIEQGLIEPPFYFNLILGNPSSAQASLLHLGTLVAELPPQSTWCVGGIGRYQSTANALGLAIGHGVRTGLEDNLWLDAQRTQLASNVQLVERIAQQAQALGRPLATPREVRHRLGLAPSHCP